MWLAIKSVLHDPPEWRPVWFFGYLVAFCLGLSALTVPPVTIQGELGSTLTVVWGLLCTVGSSLAMFAVYSPFAWLERLGIKVAALGFAMYIGGVAYLLFAGENRLPQLLGFTLGQLFFLARHLTVGHWDDRRNAREEEL